MNEASSVLNRGFVLCVNEQYKKKKFSQVKYRKGIAKLGRSSLDTKYQDYDSL